MDKIKNYIILGCSIVIIALCLTNKCTSNRLDEMTNVHSAYISELEVVKNKDGSETARREIITTSNVKDFLKLKFELDSTLTELQDLVKQNKKLLKKGGSATIYEGETKIDNSTLTNVIYNDTDKVYYTSFDDKWINYSIRASFDTTHLNLFVNNKYSIVLGTEKQGLFKPRKPYVNVTNHNPYSKTKELRTYEVTGYKPKRFGIGLNVSYGVGLNFKPQGYVGVGVNYNLIEF